MNDRAHDRAHDRAAHARRPAAAADADRRAPLECLESRTLYAATPVASAAAAADVAETFLIGGEVVSAPAAVHVTVRATAASNPGSMVVARFVAVGGDVAAVRDAFAVAVPPAAGGGVGGGFRFFPNPARAGQAVGIEFRGGNGAADRRPVMPRPVPPVAQVATTARATSDEGPADAVAATDARAADAADVTAVAPADPVAADAASARVELIAVTPATAGLTAAAAGGEAAAAAPADAPADAALAAAAGPLPGADALAAASAGPGPLTASAAAVAPAAAALAAAFASPAGTLRDALAALAADAMPAVLAGPFAAGSAFALLPTSAPSLARQILGLGFDAGGYGADGPAPAAGDAPDAVAVGAGVALAAAGYWHSTAADRDGRRSAAADAPPSRARDGFSLTPFEAR